MVCSFIGLIGVGMLGIGAGGILNDLYVALEEIEELERQGLLDDPPETISYIAKQELSFCKDLAGLRRYIEYSEAELSKLENTLAISCFVFLALLLLKVYLRFIKKKVPQ